MMKSAPAKTVHEYLREVTLAIRGELGVLRKEIMTLAPTAVEGISYGMPAYKLDGKPLAYFAVYKSHIGFYPTPSGLTKFEKELKKYPTSKGAIRFDINEPLPMDLIRKIIKHRMKVIKSEIK